MNIAIINPVLRTLNSRYFLFFEKAAPVPISELSEINIVELARELSDFGNNVTVYCASTFLEKEEIHLSNRLTLCGVPSRLMMFPRLVTFTPRLAISSSLRSADVIQSGELLQFSTFFASHVAAKTRIPFLVWQEEYRYHLPLGRPFAQLFNHTLGHFIRKVPAKFVLRTKKSKSFLTKNKVVLSNIVSWIPTGINGRVFQPRHRSLYPEDFDLPKDFAIILLVSRLTPDKGVDLAIAAMSILKKKGIRIGLLIRGSGPELNRLKTLSEKLKVQDCIRFLNRRSQLDMSYLYSSSDIFLLPSRSDLFPFALLEAGACGLPSVSTRVGCVEDFVQDGVNGILILPNSAQEIVKGISYLLSNDNLRTDMGKAARLSFEEAFDLRIVAKKFSRVYQNLVNCNSLIN